MMNNININHTRRGVSRNALTFTFITAIIFALSFTLFGCSEDDGGGDGSMISCRTDNACVEVSADACLELGGQKVQSCEAISSSSDGKEPSSSSGGNNISSSSEEDPVAGSSSSSDESLVSSSSSEDSLPSSSSETGSEPSFETVVIGEQTWMKKNLDVEVTGSKCYDDDPDNCEIYGRLYDWAMAMNLPSSCNNASCEEQIDTPHRGICPDGWHIPTDEEWGVLVEYAGGSSTAGTKLKAEAGWNPYEGIPTGTDNFGFSALPGGSGDSGGIFGNVGNYGYWWSASEFRGLNAYSRYMYYYYQDVNRYYYSKTDLRSVRCLRD